MREGWIQNDEGGRMMISSWWGVLITDRLTDKRTFVNVDTENYCIEPPHTRAQFMPIWNQTACELLILLIQYNILLDVTLDPAISLVNISGRETSQYMKKLRSSPSELFLVIRLCQKWQKRKNREKAGFWGNCGYISKGPQSSASSLDLFGQGEQLSEIFEVFLRLEGLNQTSWKA